MMTSKQKRIMSPVARQGSQNRHNLGRVNSKVGSSGGEKR